MNTLIAAQTGSGKSYMSQWLTERQLSEYGRIIIPDYKGEYDGLVDAYDPMKQWIVGEREARAPITWWRKAINQNKGLHLPRVDDLHDDHWETIVEKIATVAMRYPTSVLTMIDECRFVAPNNEKTLPAIERLASMGRGRGASTIWVTQRLQQVDSTVISQCNSRLLGPMSDRLDRQKVGGSVSYDVEVHNPQANSLDLPAALQVEGKSIPLRDYDLGADWIWSTDRGALKRIDSSGSAVDPYAEHKGAAGKPIVFPA